MTGLVVGKNSEITKENTKMTLYEKIKFGIASIFKGRSVGKVSYEWGGEEEIDGTVILEAPYTLEISEGKTVKIKSGSVKDGTVSLDDSEISLTQEGSTVTISTEYQNEETRGFGKNYLGTSEKDFIIDITALDLALEKGELKITLEYKNITIIEVTKNLGESTEETIIEILPLNNISEEGVNERLDALYKKLGNVSIETTESTVNNKIVIKHEVGTYWVTFSYDSNMDSSKLEEWKNIDKLRFIEDILNKLE